MQETFRVLQGVVAVLEGNAAPQRCFDGLICLSNPRYDLYMERPDPSVPKATDDATEKWGHLLDCLFRYLDGSMTVLEIAERHNLPFGRLRDYLVRFEEKRLIRLEPRLARRPSVSRRSV
jgi:aminopeptidase-like protein